MLKRNRAKKSCPQILDRLNFDDKIEGKEEAEAQLDEAVKELSDSGFDDLFADENLFGDDDGFFDFSDPLNPNPVDLNLPLDPCDPFATGRGSFGDTAAIDRIRHSVDAYIKLAKSPVLARSTSSMHELEALRHIITYWLYHHSDKALRDFRGYRA